VGMMQWVVGITDEELAIFLVTNGLFLHLGQRSLATLSFVMQSFVDARFTADDFSRFFLMVLWLSRASG